MPTISLTVDAQTGSRILRALGQALDCRDGAGAIRDATLEEVKGFLVERLKILVQRGEHDRIEAEALESARAATSAPVTIT